MKTEPSGIIRALNEITITVLYVNQKQIYLFIDNHA